MAVHHHSRCALRSRLIFEFMKHIGIFSIIGLLFTAIGAMAASSLPVVATPWTTTTNPATARVALGISTNVMWPLYQTNPTPAQLRAALGLLLPTDIPIISSFANNQGTLEMGQTVNSTVLTWTLAGSAVTSQSINQGVGAVPVGTLTATDSASYTASRTYVLTVGNGTTNVSASSAVTFMQKAYWGASSVSGLSDAQVIALSSAFASGRSETQTITASAQYIYFAYPASFGAASFVVNGLPNTAWNLTTRSFVNASGYTSSYDIYQSQNLLSGTYTISVQ